MSDRYRHKLGGGNVIGIEADASPDSYLDQKSSIDGDSCVISSTLLSSDVKDVFFCHARLDESVVLNSRIASSTILESQLRDSIVAHAWINQSILDDCIVRAVERESPSLTGVALRNVIVEGHSILRGPWTLDGIARIHRGVWERPPRFLEITGENGVHVGVGECTEGHAHIACRCKPIATWLRAGPRLGRMLGWQPEQISLACRTFEQWRDEPLGFLN
jgi:hypothetical protein